MIVKTEAIILKTLKYGDTSKILTLYTKEFGKISAIAKGARGIKSKFGNTLETLSHVALVLYKKDSREIQLISESTALHNFEKIRDGLGALSAAMATIELIYRTTHEEKNEQLFSLLIETLSAINRVEKNFAQLYCWFELHIAELFGFRFQLKHCPSCSDALRFSDTQKEFLVITLSFGGILCDRCASKNLHAIKISPETFFAIQSLLHRSVSEVALIEFSPSALRETEQLLRNYLQLHIEGLKPLHSEKVFRAMTF